MTEIAAAFTEQKPLLLRIAYRMLGSMSEAEDVVQDAWLRWASAGREAVASPAAFLRRIVTRLCLDRLKSARARRETYAGPWLPEPVVEDEPPDDVTLPLLLALERLSPLERAAFLLHDIFGEDFGAVSDTLGRDAAACRQLAARARRHVREERRRYPVERDRGLAIASAFREAAQQGDVTGLRGLLADDARLYSDGGGKRPAVARILKGDDEIARAFAAFARLPRPSAPVLLREGFVSGLPGYVTREADGLLQTTALLIEDGRIRAVYIMRNPDKLRHLEEEMQ